MNTLFKEEKYFCSHRGPDQLFSACLFFLETFSSSGSNRMFLPTLLNLIFPALIHLLKVISATLKIFGSFFNSKWRLSDFIKDFIMVV